MSVESQLYVRCLAWLHADDERTTCDFPTIEPYSEWLISILLGVGIMNSGNAITYNDLKSWCYLSGTKLDGFESELLHKLSNIYCACVQNYKEESTPPFETEETRINRIKANEAAMKASFQARIR